MFDFTEYDKATKTLSILQDIKDNAKVNGISRDDIKYALEAAEYFQLPERYPVNSFTAEPSKTNLSIAIESLTEGQRLGYSVLTGVIVALLAKIINYFFSGGSSGGAAPYIAKQNKTLEQFENLKKMAELEKEKADELASTDAKRTAMRKVLGDVEISEYMLQHPYTRIAFETLCSHNSKFRKCSIFLGENDRKENLRNIYVDVLSEMNDALAEMILMAEAIQDWVYARRRGGNRERLIEPQISVPGPILNRFITTGVKRVFSNLAANNLVGSGMMIDVTPPEVYTGLPIPPEDREFFTLLTTFKFMHQLDTENTGIKFAEPTDYLDRLITSNEKLLLRVTSSKVLENWKPLPEAQEKDYDPMNMATKLNEKFSSVYKKEEWNTLFSPSDKDGKDTDPESDMFVGDTWKVTHVYFDAVQSMYKESAILLKIANDVISGMHDAMRIVQQYHKELTSAKKSDDKKDDESKDK